MPESFDSMLEELAEAAIRATAPPGVEAARRRARERTVQRRAALSVLVLVLIGGSGGAWAAAREHAEATRAVSAAGAASASARPSAGRTPSSGPSTVGPPGAGVYTFANGAELSIWKTDPLSDGYLLIFSDGLVALSAPGDFPLCYGRLKSSGADTTALSAAVPLAIQPLVDVACDDFGVTSGLSVAPVKQGAGVQVAVPAVGGKPGYTRVYARQDSYPGPYSISSPMVYLPTGTWKSADKNDRTLVIGADGSIGFTAYATAGKQYTGVGAVDAVYPSGARALIDCGTPVAKSRGSVPDQAAPCGVLLIEQDQQTSDEITVYGSYGPETFIRTS
ncbi:MAG TPA: hypothetical protein VFN97_02140 [Actinospica sp.]|nr:hypothetical protein [Actinospica sp.]